MNNEEIKIIDEEGNEITAEAMDELSNGKEEGEENE